MSFLPPTRTSDTSRIFLGEDWPLLCSARRNGRSFDCTPRKLSQRWMRQRLAVMSKWKSHRALALIHGFSHSVTRRCLLQLVTQLLARKVVVVMQKQVSEKTENKPEGRFQYSLEPRSHAQRIRQLRRVLEDGSRHAGVPV